MYARSSSNLRSQIFYATRKLFQMTSGSYQPLELRRISTKNTFVFIFSNPANPIDVWKDGDRLINANLICERAV